MKNRITASILSISFLLLLSMSGKAMGQNNYDNDQQRLQIDYLKPQSYQLSAIEIIGTQSIEPEVLQALIDLQPGDQITIPGEAITAAMEKIWRQKIIKDIAVYVKPTGPKHVALQFYVEESPRLANYTLDGVTKKELRQLKDKLKISKGKVINQKLLKNIQKTIKKYFLSNGFKDVKLTIDIEEIPDNSAYKQLKIQVQKGKKVIINKIILKGNQKIDSDLLKAAFTHLKERPRFTLVKDILYKIITLHPLREGGVLRHLPSLEATIAYLKKHCIFSSSQFVPDQYLAEQQTILQYYYDRGYRDAKIVQNRLAYPRAGFLDIYLTIQEGEQYVIRNISWVGNYLYSTKKLNKILNLPAGTIYSASLLRERLQYNPYGPDVSSHYMDQGYLFFNINPVERLIEGNQVDLELRINEGSQATISNVTILGNTYTHDYIIRRELKSLPGDKFSRAKIIRSQRELAMLNIFDMKKMDVYPIPDISHKTAELVYTVKESPHFDIKLGITMKSGGSFGGNIDFGTNNFSLRNACHLKTPLGDVQNLKIKAIFYGFNHQEFVFQFLDPWVSLKKKPLALGIDMHQSFQQHQYKKNEKGLLATWGLNANVGRRLTWPDDYCSLQVGAGYTLNLYKNMEIIWPQRHFTGVMHEIITKFTISRNSLDHPTYPKNGSNINLEIKLTPPYSLFVNKMPKNIVDKLKLKEYHQTILDINWFYNFFGDWVVGLFTHGGVLGNFSSKGEIGPFERFFMGGNALADFSLLRKESISLRGYPEEYLAPISSKTRYKGGVLFDKFGVEIRHPIVQSTMLNIYALAFMEAGNVWANYKDFKLFDLYRSFGVGVRCFLPIGAIGLDWGFGIDKKSKETLELTWSLGGGTGR